METVIDIFFHLDAHLNEWISFFGPWIYLILFLIIFCETGLVVTPFLPGDSLLFALGALAATEGAFLRLPFLMTALVAAAILGDTVNYAVGRRAGAKIFHENRRWLNIKHLRTTEEFYEKHGGKTIILARFIPIIRTFAPFVAGVGKMNYSRFVVFNITGGLAWVMSILLTGFSFGNLPIIKRNFEVVIVAIIVLSCLPPVIHLIRGRDS